MSNKLKLELIKAKMKKENKSNYHERLKKKSVAVAESILSSDNKWLNKLGNRVFSCGSFIRWGVCPNGHGRKITQANFCERRICPSCAYRRSYLVSSTVLSVAHEHLKRYKTDIPLLLTLTVPNCSADQLTDTITDMRVGFKRLQQTKAFKRSVRSWFRALEVTYNEEKDSYHPHYHVLLMVPGNYFTRSRNFYIHHDEWLRLWRRSMRNESITQVDIRMVKPKKGDERGVSGAAKEVAKYATKVKSYVKEVQEGYFYALPDPVRVLATCLHKRRLYGFGGLFRSILREMKLTGVESDDFSNVPEAQTSCSCKICKSGLLEEIQTWNYSTGQYLAKKTSEKIEAA